MNQEARTTKNDFQRVLLRTAAEILRKVRFIVEGWSASRNRRSHIPPSLALGHLETVFIEKN